MKNKKNDLNQDLFYQEFIRPLYDKYEDDPNFTTVAKDGTKMWNIQYALVKESDTFTPIFCCTEEEPDRKKVVGFRVQGYPQYLLTDAQYSGVAHMKGGSDEMLTLFGNVMKTFADTGKTVSLISYVGFADAYEVGGTEDNKNVDNS